MDSSRRGTGLYQHLSGLHLSRKEVRGYYRHLSGVNPEILSGRLLEAAFLHLEGMDSSRLGTRLYQHLSGLPSPREGDPGMLPAFKWINPENLSGRLLDDPFLGIFTDSRDHRVSKTEPTTLLEECCHSAART